ncbi:MAG: hypothetical protein GF364_16310 [Candidatus Lokiarchaeota archaeon]|nr:hypothetical protein [Candidatus Lokiarchaeota archaeon]
MKRRVFYLMVMLISALIALISALTSDLSPKSILSSILIGLWIFITSLFLSKIRSLREFNSPHNRGFLIVTALIVGVFYTYWGIFTGILAENLTDNDSLYISLWSLIFGVPYLLYSFIQIWKSFQKYYSIYFGMKSMNARKFAIFCVMFVIIIEIILSLISAGQVEPIDFDFAPNYDTPNYILLIFSILLVLILIVFGFIRKPVDISEISTSEISARMDRVSRRAEERARRARDTERRAREADRRRDAGRRQKAREAKRRRELERRKRAQEAKAKSKRRSQKKRKSKRVSSKKKKKAKAAKLRFYKRLRPKTTVLTKEDFKCIFCFEIPKYPEDKGRGVVLCPVCNYPAHADEFKEWSQSSPLCSRCDSPIPAKFRRNPKVYSVKDYYQACRFWLKRMKKK